MLTTHEVAGDQFAWVRAKGLRGRYELRAEGANTPLAVLNVQDSVGDAEIHGATYHTYHFARVGWLGSRVNVWANSLRAPIAVFRGGWASSSVEIAGSTTYHWKKPHFWTPEHDWVDTAGQVLVRMRPLSGREVRVILEPMAQEKSDVELLVVLGEFLLAVANQDALTGAVMSVVGAGGAGA